MHDDKSYYIVEGTIDESGGIRVNMIIDRVLWRPGQVMYDSILNRE